MSGILGTLAPPAQYPNIANNDSQGLCGWVIRALRGFAARLLSPT